MNGNQQIDPIAMVGQIQNGVNDALADMKKILSQLLNERNQFIATLEKYRSKFGEIDAPPAPAPVPVNREQRRTANTPKAPKPVADKK